MTTFTFSWQHDAKCLEPQTLLRCNNRISTNNDLPTAVTHSNADLQSGQCKYIMSIVGYYLTSHTLIYGGTILLFIRYEYRHRIIYQHYIS